MRRHRRPAVAVNNQLPKFYLLLLDRFSDQLFGQIGTLSVSEHPADGAPAVNVDDRVKVVISPFFRAFELGDVPGPNFVGAAGQELRLLVLRATELITPLTHTLVVIEDAIHRSDTAKVFAFVEQLGVNLPRRLVRKALTVELVQYRLSFNFGQCPRRS